MNKKFLVSYLIFFLLVYGCSEKPISEKQKAVNAYKEKQRELHITNSQPEEIENINGERLAESSHGKIVSSELESRGLLKEAEDIASFNVFYEQLFNVTHDQILSSTPFINKGIKHASEGNFQEAKNYFNSSKFKHSAQQLLDVVDQLDEGLITEDYALHYFKGVNYFDDLQVKEAIKEFVAAIEINPNFPLAYSLLGYAYGFLGYPEKGIGYLNKALEIDPNFIEAYLYLGKIYGHLLDQAQQAVTYFEKAIDLNPDSVIPYSMLSSFLVFIKQPQQAFVYSQKALEIDPNYIGTYLELTQIYFFLQEYDKALSYAMKCFEVIPENPVSTFMLVQLYRYLGRPQEAIPYLEKTLELNPDSPLTSLMYLGLGKIYWGLQQREKAVKYYLKAWEFNQNDFVALTLLTSYYFSTKQYEQTIFFAKKMLELAPEGFEVPVDPFFWISGSSETISYNPAKVYGIIGGSYVALEQYQKAIPYLENALQGEADKREIYRILVYAYRQLGNYEKAYEIEKQAVEENLQPLKR